MAESKDTLSRKKNWKICRNKNMSLNSFELIEMPSYLKAIND